MTTRTKVILIIVAIAIFAPVFFHTALINIFTALKDTWTAITTSFPGITGGG